MLSSATEHHKFFKLFEKNDYTKVELDGKIS